MFIKERNNVKNAHTNSLSMTYGWRREKNCFLLLAPPSAKTCASLRHSKQATWGRKMRLLQSDSSTSLPTTVYITSHTPRCRSRGATPSSQGQSKQPRQILHQHLRHDSSLVHSKNTATAPTIRPGESVPCISTCLYYHTPLAQNSHQNCQQRNWGGRGCLNLLVAQTAPLGRVGQTQGIFPPNVALHQRQAHKHTHACTSNKNK